jgi:Flp pilus assembly protein TadG
MSESKAGATRFRRREDGQSLLEFALIVPIFLLIVMATIDFAWGLRAYITITNSAREGARLAVTLGPNDPDTPSVVQDYVAERSSDLVASGDVTVSYPDGPASENPVSVTAEYDYQYITPVGGLLSLISGGSLSDALHMSSTSTMKVE